MSSGGPVGNSVSEGLFSLQNEIPLLIVIAEQNILLGNQLVGDIEHTDESKSEIVLSEEGLVVPGDILK